MQRVVVLDDDPDIIETLGEILQGYEVQGVGDWKDLLKSLHDEPYPEVLAQVASQVPEIIDPEGPTCASTYPDAIIMDIMLQGEQACYH